jgi:hypothetical protein
VEAEWVLLLLSQVREQARRASEDRNGLHRARRKPEVEQHRRDRHRHVHRQRLPPFLRHRVPEAPRELDVSAAHAVFVRELEDPLCPRVERAVHRVAEAGHLAAGRVDFPHHGCGIPRAGEQPRTLLRRAENDRARAEDPGRDGALQRPGVGGQRHPGRDVGGHQPVLGDRHQQQVEEEALVVRRLLAGQEEVEILGEAQPPHQVAGEVAAADLDAVGTGLRDAGDRRVGQDVAAGSAAAGSVKNLQRT